MFESCERPAWLSNDLYAFHHRFITNREMRRIRLNGYYVLSKGEKHCNVHCKAEEK